MMARCFAAGTLLAALSACGGDDDNQDAEGAKRLHAQIQQDDYRSWARAPGYEVRRTSTAPHGGEVDIYMNEVIAGILAATEPAISWPTGAILAKDGWNGSTLHIVAIMQKRSDGWFFAELDGSGEPQFSGRPAICVDCHSAGSDYVRAFDLPN